MRDYFLAIDAGTTSSRTVIFDSKGDIAAIAQQEFPQIYPQKGWVEHDPMVIWDTQRSTIHRAIEKAGIEPTQIVAIGITNQRETTVVWDKITGKPVYNAIVWQCRRTAAICDKLRANGKAEMIFEKTGLILDPYFSATKIRWILEDIPEARRLCDENRLMFGTIDSWLLYNLTGGNVHSTDFSNASRTMLFNINTLQWDDELCDLFGVPKHMLPDVCPSGHSFGMMEKSILGTEIPITAMIGDQQAALFGQLCFHTGDAKMTYGTGGFILSNIGHKPILSKNRLLTTIAWQFNGKTVYAEEGSVFIAGAAIQWLRDNLGIIDNSAESDRFAADANPEHGLVFVPAFTGLGAPYWRSDAKGLIYGITRDTGKREIVRACLEGIAFSTKDVVDAISKDTGIDLLALKVDGGASANNFLMQFQSDILNIPVERPVVFETTAQGAALLAGLAAGYFSSFDELKTARKTDRVFSPSDHAAQNKARYSSWQHVIEALLR